MPDSCAAYGCTNRRKKGSGISFHKFPLGKATLLGKWIASVSRENFHPTKNHYVCSEHFLKKDYLRGIHPRDDHDFIYHELCQLAVPSIFPTLPPRKQEPRTKKRPVPRERTQPTEESISDPQPWIPVHPRDDHDFIYHELCELAVPSIFPALPPRKQKPRTKKRPVPRERTQPTEESISDPQPCKKTLVVSEDHPYCKPSSLAEKELKCTKQALKETRKELKVAKQKLKRQDARISNLLQTLKDQSLINQGLSDILNLFEENTNFTLIENEQKAGDSD